MNYYKLYYSIIDSVRLENRVKGDGVYFEKHHIIPLCCSGEDEENNLILLTAREHFICHYLLTKFNIVDDNQQLHKLKEAFVGMAFRNSDKHKISSKMYEKAKIMNGELSSERIKSGIGWGSKKAKLKQSKTIRGEGHHTFSGYYLTPWGKYPSALQATKKCPVKFDIGTLIKWCKNSSCMITSEMSKKSKYIEHIKTNVIGKTTQDIGFSFEVIT